VTDNNQKESGIQMNRKSEIYTGKEKGEIEEKGEGEEKGKGIFG
jgi:hypothetical protein